jgi:predicted nucleic acid-binding protein
MIAVDTNILVYAHRSDSIFNSKAVSTARLPPLFAA